MFHTYIYFSIIYFEQVKCLPDRIFSPKFTNNLQTQTAKLREFTSPIFFDYLPHTSDHYVEGKSEL